MGRAAMSTPTHARPLWLSRLAQTTAVRPAAANARPRTVSPPRASRTRLHHTAPARGPGRGPGLGPGRAPAISLSPSSFARSALAPALGDGDLAQDGLEDAAGVAPAHRRLGTRQQ